MDGRSLVSRSQVSRQTLPTTICCVCGVPIIANSVNTCGQCLQSRYDITADLEKQIVLIQCKRCEKYQKDDATWTRADPESKELLAFCLRRIRNLKTLRLIDASFKWTEPHSKRLKVKVKVQKEVEKSVILQQSCMIEYIVQHRMCADCHRTEASLTWDAVVQLRQFVPHKRTFLFLEQIILKHNAQERAIKIEAQPDGVDFFFPNKSDGVRFTSFLDAVVPIRIKQSEKLISADLKSNVSSYNFSYSVEIAPICKDDVVLLSSQTANQYGGISRICLCLNVGSMIRLIDPMTTKFCEISSQTYWQHPFKALVDASRLVEFVVLDVTHVDDGDVAGRSRTRTIEGNDEEEEEDEPELEAEVASGYSKQTTQRKRRRKANAVKKFSSSARLSTKHALCEVEVAKMKDFGNNDLRYTVRCHLGFVLKPGDYALGYDLRTSNFNFQDDAEKPIEFPEIILVKKHYPRATKYERHWHLKSIAAEAPDQPGLGMGVKGEHSGDVRDMEIFMRDLEEDSEMRGKVNLYVKGGSAMKKQNQAADPRPTVPEDWPPEVPLEELLTDMHLSERSDVKMGDDEEDEEDDEDDDDL